MSRILITVLLALIVGCSERFAILTDMSKQLIDGPQSVELTAEQIQNLSSRNYPAAYIQVGQSARLAVLASYHVPRFDNTLETIWGFEDGAYFTTRYGRIYNTHFLNSSNLTWLTLSEDPLKDGLLNDPSTISYELSISWGVHYQYLANARLTRLSEETVITATGNQSLTRYEEEISLPSLGASYTNVYWVSPESGQVIKSEQYTYPGSPLISLEMIVLPPMEVGE